MHLGHRDPMALTLDASFRADSRDDGAAYAIFAEGQRIGVTRIRVRLCILGAMIVTKEGVGEPCRVDFMGVECSVRLLPSTLFGEPCPLRAVEQGDMDARLAPRGTR